VQQAIEAPRRRGDYYSLVPGEANALEPRKRPRSTLQSTLVMKDGQPYMVTGSPGGDDQIMRTMHVAPDFERGKLPACEQQVVR
jgi:gamma-glutamyltranspeptidase